LYSPGPAVDTIGVGSLDYPKLITFILLSSIGA